MLRLKYSKSLECKVSLFIFLQFTFYSKPIRSHHISLELNCSGFEKDIATSKYEIMAHIDRISLVGNYKARGNILLLPIFGNGPANLTFGKFFASIKLDIQNYANE